MGRFQDPEGIFTSWYGKYPELITRPSKPIPWSRARLNSPVEVEVLDVEVIAVWDGPPAPFPKRPTADQFAEGVEIALWLMAASHE
jgi:hypothetical protein